MQLTRFLVWLSVVCTAAVAALAYGQITTSFDTPSVGRVILFIALGLTGLLSVFLFPQFRNIRATFLAIWIPAVLLRLFLLPTAVSDDVSRYLFEGKLIRSGISPYQQTADAESLVQYRDDQWALMNHKDKPTAYPPLVQMIFAMIGLVVYHPLAYKLVFVLADLLTLGAILKLLARRGMSRAFSGLYALNPVVLVAFAGEGHFDSLMLAPLMWGVYAYEIGRKPWAIVLASVATGIKWIALPLIPFFVGKRIWPGVLIAVAVLVLPGIYFLETLQSLFQGLFAFVGTRNFNGPLYAILLDGAHWPRSICNLVVLTVFVSVILWRWIKRARVPLESHLRWVIGTLLVVSPTVHFWYLVWILPLVCLRPTFPWLMVSVTSGSYFFVWFNAAEDSRWVLEPWQHYLFWGPFVLACIYEIWSTRGWVLCSTVRSKESPDPVVGVVIPVLNVEKTLKETLESIEQQTIDVEEVIVVDADSNDSTLQIIEESELPIRVLQSERGRGVQIATGMEAASSDWLLILHADVRLEPTAVEHILQAVNSDRRIIGGALGQRFQSQHFRLLLIELLNDLRALFTRTAFGDQAQFFYREAAIKDQLMPKQPLMEDVESSWRVREQGGFVFLNQPCQANCDKWQRSRWINRFCLVLRLVSRYRWARLRGRSHAEALSKKFYAEYYSG